MKHLLLITVVVMAIFGALMLATSPEIQHIGHVIVTWVRNFALSCM